LLKRLILVALIVAFAYAIYTYRAELVTIVDVLRGGVWYAVLAGVGVVGLGALNQAWLYASLYDVVDLPAEKKHLLPIFLTTRFVMVAAPSGGLSGWVPFIQDARQRDIPVGMVIIVNLVYMVLWYSSFAIFLLAGLLFLFLSHDLQWFEVTAAATLMFIDVVMIGGLVLALVAPGPLERILLWAVRTLRRGARVFRRQEPFTDEHVSGFAGDLNEATTMMRHAGWRRLSRPVLHALGVEALNLAVFYLMFLAFGVRATFALLVAGYSVAILFFIISPTPGGLGFVEGALIGVLTALDVPLAQATTVTFAFRGLTFWMPFVLGFIALRWAARQPAAKTSSDAISDVVTAEVSETV
jgi:uncharacterized protein (TIRG00374 family)